ncbi:glycosyltransferase family 4 protein [Thomasclavelia spiroformis]|uniref:glycosyltransferase family 4 protein n=1 Tax=Thomasclavelia spiroformis TaxID=29348 RepID=UPI00241FBA74|nr:glycosyltransferase family 4 protein [Thomasclavelia spiroformis]MBS6685937.1 glycosyltransferase family 4 protein [Thomasclavelia spiroformis]
MKVLLTATVQSHICQFHKPLVEILHTFGYEVHVAAKDNLREKNGLKLDFVEKIYNIPFSRSPKSKDNLRAYNELKKIIENERYDVIHCNTPMGGIITRLAAKKARKLGTKVFYTAHGFHFYKGAPKKNWLIYYPIEKYFSRITDLIITITQEDYLIAKNKFHCKVEHMHGVGVDKNKFDLQNVNIIELKERYGFSYDDFIVLTIGELNENKNQIVILKAILEVKKYIPNIKYLLAGNGPKLDELQKFVRKNDLENTVIFLGYTTKVNEYLNIADILVSASRREGLPLNIMEGMLSKTCVVASKNRGHNELICHLNTGLLFDSENSEQIKEYILDIYENKTLRDALVKNAYDFIQSFTYASIKKELRKIYREILSDENGE